MHEIDSQRFYRERGLWTEEQIGWLLENAAARWGDREFLLIDSYRLGFAGLNRLVQSAASFLTSCGVHQGDRIVMQSGNCIELIVLQFAAWRIGAISVPIVPIYRTHEMRAIIDETKPKIIAAAREAGARCPYIEIDELLLTLDERPHTKILFGKGDPVEGWTALPLEASADETVALPEPAATEQCCTILFTSGSTSAPKGVLMSSRALMSGLQNWHLNLEFASDAIACSGAPLTHIGGLYTALLVPLYVGARTVLMPRWDPDVAVELIASERATYMAGATLFLQDLVERYERGASPLYRLQSFTTGGSATPPSLIHRAERVGIKANRSYGMTETCGTISQISRNSPIEVRANTDGRVTFGSELQIVDDAGDLLPFGEVGHIRIRSPQMMNGYINRAITEAQLKDGWFDPGDLGALSEDGYLTVTGRSKDIINRGGEKFSCRDIETALMEYEDVFDAAVIGLPHPRFGETVCACLVLRDGANWPGPQGILAHLEQTGLARPKFPVDWEVFDSFPRTSSSKVQKNRLIEVILERRSGGNLEDADQLISSR